MCVLERQNNISWEQEKIKNFFWNINFKMYNDDAF